MANNNAIFDGVLAGFIGGSSTRWITSIVAADYNTQRASALVFAGLVDALIPFSASIASIDGQIVQAICEGLFSDRFPSNQNLSQLAQSVVALYTSVKAGSLPVAPKSGGQIQYDAAAPFVVNVMPAGHTPGQYVLTCTQFCTVAGGGGSVINYTIGWNQPNFGAATLNVGNSNIAGTGLVSTTQRAVESSGSADITATFTPGSVTGNPRTNILVSAALQANPIS